MIDEYVKNHDDKEVIAYIAKMLVSADVAMEKALNEQNMYNLAASVYLIADLSEYARALDKKVNGPKSKVL